MRSFLLNKLVRDKVFENILHIGQKPQYRTLEGPELLVELQRKLLEEAKEFDPNNKDAAKELADLLEVIEAIGQEIGKDFTQLRKIQTDLREERGGFDKKVYIGRLDMDDGDPWANYYAKEPDRFTEIKE
jgi:predicted house-cleaning noncanonical NTP pyrophosphatase (MazG superfamily)